MKSAPPLFFVLGLTLFALGGATSARAQAIKVYISAPGVSTETYNNAQVEPFSTFTAGLFTNPQASTALALGGTNATYTPANPASPASSIINGGTYAASSTSGNYLAVTPGNSVTLSLAVAVPYLGVDIAALDNGNNLSFYSGPNGTGSLLGTFNAGSIKSLFANPTVRAVNGQAYNSSSYLGQPGSGNDGGEYFAFAHFFPQNGVTIRSVVFSQTQGGNFETDNHSLLTTAPAVDGTFVAVPEPSTWALLLGGAGLLGIAARRRAIRV